jgi:hypothetical protein
MQTNRRAEKLTAASVLILLHMGCLTFLPGNLVPYPVPSDNDEDQSGAAEEGVSTTKSSSHRPMVCPVCCILSSITNYFE